MDTDDDFVFQIHRPDPSLLHLYIVRSILTGPLLIIMIPVHLVRYFTLNYAFDQEGITMRWGLIFRHEIRLNYTRIQDIHVTSGLLQRWFGLADLQVQTAAGGAMPEMTLEGIPEYGMVRDFLYRHMRGYKDMHAPKPVAAGVQAGATDASSQELLTVLTGIRDEIRGAREALERSRQGGA